MVYALKVLNKKKLIAKKQLKYAVSEANILKKMNSQFIISLHYAFQTSQHLYMALDNCPNGDLSEIIIVRERLAEDTACFVIAQVILAV
jgi:serine/threonine protein kinase